MYNRFTNVLRCMAIAAPACHIYLNDSNKFTNCFPGIFCSELQIRATCHVDGI